MNLYGSMRVYFEFTRTVPVSTSSRVKFVMTVHQNSKNIGLCLYGDFDMDFSLVSIYCVGLFGKRLSVTSQNIIQRSDDETLHGIRQNIALGQNTTQSSLAQPGYSLLAVDGNTNQMFNEQDWEQNSVTCTLEEYNPWWEVSFGENRLLREVTIFKRDGDYLDDLSDFTINVFDSNGSIVLTHVYSDAAPMTVTINLDDVIGSRLRITLNGNQLRVLSLAEVQVFGDSILFDIPMGFLLSFPTGDFNRIAFVQDQEGVASKTYTIQDIEIYESNEEYLPVSFSCYQLCTYFCPYPHQKRFSSIIGQHMDPNI